MSNSFHSNMNTFLYAVTIKKQSKVPVHIGKNTDKLTDGVSVCASRKRGKEPITKIVETLAETGLQFSA